MSEGTLIHQAYALEVAEKVVKKLKPWCERIEIAGSLRRNRGFVHDIEICAIPAEEEDLFHEKVRSDVRIREALEELGLTWSSFLVNGPLNKRFWLDGIKVDLFLTTPAQWGVIFLLRTGDADFSKCMVTNRQHGGMMPSNMRVKDGRIWRNGDLLETPEEEDVFREYGLAFVQPEERNEC